MSPQIIKEKAGKILEYLRLLEKYKDIAFNDYINETHYLERLLELLVTTSSDILMHKFALENESIPATLRTVFLRAAELKWLPGELADNLSNAAGMRNLLVHGYDKIDHKLIYDRIKPALRDYTQFADIMLKDL